MITKRTLQSLMAGTMLAAGFVTTTLVATADATENQRPRVYTNQQFLDRHRAQQFGAQDHRCRLGVPHGA